MHRPDIFQAAEFDKWCELPPRQTAAGDIVVQGVEFEWVF
jgi:hypothetical protein